MFRWLSKQRKTLSGKYSVEEVVGQIRESLSDADADQCDITPADLAQLLFKHLVLEEENKAIKEERAKYKAEPGFNKDAYRQQVFLYLVANVAIALASETETRPQMDKVTALFKGHVQAEMRRRWHISEDQTNEMIGDAASKLAKLLFTDPDLQRGLSFEWAQEWLGRVGIAEYNPAKLFQISTAWKLQFGFLAKTLRQFHVS